MTDPLAPWKSGHLHAVCQIMRLEDEAETTLVDLVTLAPTDEAAEPLPAGTPVTVRFGSRPVHDARQLVAIMSRWEQLAAVVDLTVDTTPGGLHCRFSAEEFELIVVAGPPGPSVPGMPG